MSSAWRKWRAPLALGFALVCGIGADAAMAQFYFRPFAYSYRYDLPPPPLEDDGFDGPRFASRRAVARILAREGFELIGPLGRRGDQLVATGVSPREGEMRFFIDPFEGVIIRAISLGPPLQADRPQPRDDGFIPPLGGSHPVVKEIGRDRAPANEGRGNERVRRLARPAPQSPVAEPTRPAARDTARPAPQAAPPAPASTATAPTPKAAGAQKPVEWAPPAEISKPAEAAKPAAPPKAAEAPKPAEPPKPVVANPPEPAKPADAAKPAEARTSAGKADTAKTDAAKTDAATDAKRPTLPSPIVEAAKPPARTVTAKSPAPRATAARSTGSTHRAIVPPKSTEGATAVTPSAPAAATAHSPEGAKTPQSVASPKAQ